MNLYDKVFRSFDEQFEGDEREVMVFIASLGQEILNGGGMALAEAANGIVQKYTATELKGADKKKKAMAEVRAAVGETTEDGSPISDTAIDCAIQAALANYRAMKAAQ